METSDFLFPQHQYHGSSLQTEDIVLHGYLQEFSQQVLILTSLNRGGRLSSQETYQKLKQLYKQLKNSRKDLDRK